jgi:hypothetical protein
MDDPAAVSELQGKIKDLDAEYLKGDPSSKFFITNKAAMGRLRTMGMYGAEPDYHDESKISVITSSLSEGWKAEHIPMLANIIRGGSYARAVSTALGGAEVKVTGRAFQNYTIGKEDCMANRGLLVPINGISSKLYTGRYLVGSDIPLTEADVHKHMGRVIEIRSPVFCRSEGTTICYKCMGDVISNSNIGITGLMTGVTTNFLNLFMALVHTSALSTAPYNYKERIT